MTTKNETPKNNFNATIGNTVLCDGFLIPMTDFVLEQLNEQNSRTKPMREVFNSLEKYAKFLKQPLKLEMFVPCDEDGNVLEEPKIEEEYVDEHTTQIFAQYQYDLDKAKEKVLFEGFEITDETEFLISKYGFSLYFNQIEDFNIEHLLTWSNEIQLTENAIKQIGL